MGQSQQKGDKVQSFRILYYDKENFCCSAIDISKMYVDVEVFDELIFDSLLSIGIESAEVYD